MQLSSTSAPKKTCMWVTQDCGISPISSEICESYADNTQLWWETKCPCPLQFMCLCKQVYLVHSQIQKDVGVFSWCAVNSIRFCFTELCKLFKTQTLGWCCCLPEHSWLCKLSPWQKISSILLHRFSLLWGEDWAWLRTFGDSLAFIPTCAFQIVQNTGL